MEVSSENLILGIAVLTAIPFVLYWLFDNFSRFSKYKCMAIYEDEFMPYILACISKGVKPVLPNYMVHEVMKYVSIQGIEHEARAYTKTSGITVHDSYVSIVIDDGSQDWLVTIDKIGRCEVVSLVSLGEDGIW